MKDPVKSKSNMMDYVVSCDRDSEELEKLIRGEKTMIVRGSMIRKMPYNKVKPGEILYFVNNDGDGLVRAAAVVKKITEYGPVNSEESLSLLKMYQHSLYLSEKQMQQYIGKRYMVLIEVVSVCRIMEFRLDQLVYESAIDWLPVKNIELMKDKYLY